MEASFDQILGALGDKIENKKGDIEKLEGILEQAEAALEKAQVRTHPPAVYIDADQNSIPAIHISECNIRT